MIHTWLTEYEFSIKRKKAKLVSSRHPNGSYKIAEFNLQLSEPDFLLYRRLLGVPRSGHFKLENDIRINFQRSSSSRINSVVVLAKDIHAIAKKFERDRLIVYNGKPALEIQNPNKKMWNVIVREAE